MHGNHIFHMTNTIEISQLLEALWKTMGKEHIRGLLSGMLGPAEQEGMAGYQFYREMSEAIRLVPEAKDAQDLLRMVEKAMRSIDEVN